MTTFDTGRTGTAAPSFFSNLLGTLASWNDARITRKSLSKLTARELDDIGLNRGDIDEIAQRGTRF